MSEGEILKELQNGSQMALKKLFDTYYAELTRYAIKIIGNPEIAEEIVQDIFVSVWEKREKNQIKSARAYLSRAVKNRCINYIKSNSQIHDSVENSMQAVSDASPETAIEMSELSVALAEAERRLPKQTALVFALSRHTELTYPQISGELNISIKTVEYHISKALKSMRKFLDDNGIFFIIGIHSVVF